MRKSFFYYLLVLLCPITRIVAQSPPHYLPLSVGEALPEAVFSRVYNLPDSAVRISQFKGKLVIIDFWATWCGACIGGFPKLEALQKKYPDKLQVLLVNARQTGDNLQQIEAALQRYKSRTGYRLKLPYIVGDTVLQTLFPHQYLPHLVWMGPDGKFITSTYSEAATPENVEAIMSNSAPAAHFKKDSLAFDDSMLLLGTDTASTPIAYRSIFTGYIEGLGFKAARRTENGGHTRYRIINYPLSYFYANAFTKELGLPPSQLIFSPGIPESFKTSYLHPAPYKDAYCYELYLPDSVGGNEVKALLRQDLVRNFRVSVKRVPKLAKFWVVGASAQTKKLVSKGGFEEIRTSPADTSKYIQNVPIAVLFDILNDISDTPIAGSTGITANVDIPLPDGIYQYPTARLLEWLRSIGFSITAGEKVMDFSVFSPSAALGEETLRGN